MGTDTPHMDGLCECVGVCVCMGGVRVTPPFQVFFYYFFKQQLLYKQHMGIVRGLRCDCGSDKSVSFSGLVRNIILIMQWDFSV